MGVSDDGATLDDIAGFFTLSEEFSNSYDGTSDREFLTAVYANVLGRDADQSGFDYWLELLESGQLDRAGTVRWVAANDEFTLAHPLG